MDMTFDAKNFPKLKVFCHVVLQRLTCCIFVLRLFATEKIFSDIMILQMQII